MSNSNAAQIAARIVVEIKALNLNGSPEVQARKRMFSDGGAEDRRPLYRGVTVVPDHDTTAGGTNERENVGYVFNVGLMDGSASEFVDSDWGIADWGERIRRRFAFRRITDLPSTLCELHCNVGRFKRPSDVQLQDGEDFGVLTITCLVREPRTND